MYHTVQDSMILFCPVVILQSLDSRDCSLSSRAWILFDIPGFIYCVLYHVLYIYWMIFDLANPNLPCWWYLKGRTTLYHTVYTHDTYL